MRFGKGSITGRIIALLYFITLFSTMVLLIFVSGNKEYYLKRDFGMSGCSFLLFGIAFSAVIFFLLYIAEKLIKKNGIQGDPGGKSAVTVIAGLSLILFISEMVFSFSAFFFSDWDPAAVLSCVYKVLNGAQGEVSLDYFSNHPNNLMLVFIYVWILRIAGIFGTESVLSLMVFQSLLFTLTGVIFFRIVEECHSFKAAIIAWILYAVWIGLNPWLLITYSDGAGLIFPVLIVRLFQIVLSRQGSARKAGISEIIICCLLGASASLGYAVKPQTVITYIAVLLIMALKLIFEKDREIIKKIVLTLISFLSMWLIITRLFYPSLGLDLNKEKAFGFSHYIMMGLNGETDGVYSNEDTVFTDSFSDPVERKEANIRVSGERLKAYGFLGLMDHLEKKQLVNFSDGTFSWGIDGNFFAGTNFEGIPEIKENALREKIMNVIVVGAPHFGKYAKGLQTLWFTVLLFCTLEGARLTFLKAEEIPGAGTQCDRKRPGNESTESVIMLSLIGLVMFELIFEAKARYLFTYLPLFLFSAFSGGRWIYLKLKGLLPS